MQICDSTFQAEGTAARDCNADMNLEEDQYGWSWRGQGRESWKIKQVCVLQTLARCPNRSQAEPRSDLAGVGFTGPSASCGDGAQEGRLREARRPSGVTSAPGER